MMTRTPRDAYRYRYLRSITNDLVEYQTVVSQSAAIHSSEGFAVVVNKSLSKASPMPIWPFRPRTGRVLRGLAILILS